MLKVDYEVLLAHVYPRPSMLWARDFADQTPRTLAYGYTCERDSFHVYIQDGAINKVVYRFAEPASVLIEHKHEREGLLLTECVPDKRLYPELCDFAFCALLKARGVEMSFTTWKDRTPTELGRRYHGQLLEQLATGLAA